MAQTQNKIPNHEAHLFICTNKKEKGESCGAKDSGILREQLKKLIDEKYPQWRGRVRINASGCLGPCAKGIVSVCYPQGDWHTELKSTDIEYLEEYLKKILVTFIFVFIFNVISWPFSNANIALASSAKSVASRSISSKATTPTSAVKEKCPTETFIELKDDYLNPVFKKGQTLKIQKLFEVCGLKLHKSEYVVLKNKKVTDPPRVLKIYGRSLDRIKLKDNQFLINELYAKFDDGEFIKNSNPLFIKLTKNKPYGFVIPKNKFLLFSEQRKGPFVDSREFGLFDKNQIDAIVIKKK